MNKSDEVLPITFRSICSILESNVFSLILSQQFIDMSKRRSTVRMKKHWLLACGIIN